MKAIYDLGGTNGRDKSLRKLRGARGPAESIYLNRAYFGLYSLLHRLGATVTTRRETGHGERSGPASPTASLRA